MGMELCAVTPPGGKSVKQAYASINPKGRITFNRLASKHIGNFEYCQLYFDPQRMMFGVKLVHDEKADQARKIAGKGRPQRFIYANDAYEHYKLKIPAVTRFNVSYDESKRMIIVDLNLPIANQKASKSKSESQVNG